MNIKQISVIGAGTMGNGIAHCFAQHGYQVTLLDNDAQQLDTALATISANLQRQVRKDKIQEVDKIASLGRIKTTTSPLKAFENANLIIEAVSENKAVKKMVFQEADQIKSKDCVLASNTSSISITALGALTSQPQQVIGMHFMNPVPMMPLVEIIVGHDTDATVVQQITELSHAIGKTPLVVQDAPGFVANRILMPMINEAIETLLQGIGGVTEIDQIMKLGMGHPMGPLQLADFIGLDVCLAILEVMHQEFGKDKYAPSTLLRKLVAANHLGRKTGIGFYDYRKDPKNPTVAPQLYR